MTAGVSGLNVCDKLRDTNTVCVGQVEWMTAGVSGLNVCDKLRDTNTVSVLGRWSG